MAPRPSTRSSRYRPTTRRPAGSSRSELGTAKLSMRCAVLHIVRSSYCAVGSGVQYSKGHQHAGGWLMGEPRRAESGFELHPVYQETDISAGLGERLGAAGEYPFTRGVYPTMYTKRPWT